MTKQSDYSKILRDRNIRDNRPRVALSVDPIIEEAPVAKKAKPFTKKK